MKCFDLQVNGGLGIDFSDPELTKEQFLKVANHLLATGTTRFLPTMVTSPMEIYRRNLVLMNEAIKENQLEYQIPGYHLEGPFISDQPGAVGAHNPDFVQKPTLEKLQELWQLSDHKIKIITFAAEVEGVDRVIAEASKLGIVCSLGHQLASGDDIQKATAAGAKLLTHLGNGIPNLINRHVNPIWTGLANDDLIAMIIPDGHHLPLDVLKCMIRCKGIKNLIATSDASQGAGLPPGRYRLLGNDAVIEPNGKLHNPEKQCLVGSAMNLPQCIKFMQDSKLLSDAEIETIVWTNPNQLIG